MNTQSNYAESVDTDSPPIPQEQEFALAHWFIAIAAAALSALVIVGAGAWLYERLSQ